MKTYKIHLIRHGLTEANLNGSYCGTLDMPLCEEGREQLYELLDTYEYPFVERVYASPLERARETAEILFPGNDYIAVENLREASFGRFEGKRMADLEEDEEFAKWLVPGGDFTPAGVEPARNFYVRCRQGMIQVVDDMMQSGITSAAVVTHAGVISAIMAALAVPRRSVYDWNCEAGRGFTLRADPSIFLREPILELVREIPELQSDPDPDDDPLDVYEY